MTVSQALEQGKAFCTRHKTEIVKHLAPFNNPSTPVKHIFLVTMPDQDNNTYLIFTDDDLNAYFFDSNAPREGRFIEIKKEKKTVWVNMWKSDLGEIKSTSFPYGTKAVAERDAIFAADLIGIFPVEIEI